MALPAIAGVTSAFAGWRGLGRFWLGVLLLLAACASILQMLGAPVRPAPPEKVKVTVRVPTNLTTTIKSVPPPQRPGRDVAGPIENPDPALSQPAPGIPHGYLPRIAADGRMPMRTYAAPFDPNNLHPRVGLLIAGIGMNDADSMAVINTLPSAITLAVSPYASDPSKLLAAARVTDHEYLLSVPMEPQGYPLSDPDDQHALMTALPPIENLPRLYWALSRLSGYVGITNALGSMRGERLTGQPDQMESVLDDIGHRGLLFVDGRPGAERMPLAWNRAVDIVIDDDAADTATLDKRLEALSGMASDRGSALGLVSLPRPKTLERIAAWVTTLSSKGLALAPVSALVMPPVQGDPEK